MPDYAAHGKQVLCDGVHFADACDPEAAALIVRDMNARPAIVAYIRRETERRPMPRFLKRLLDIYADNIAARFDEGGS